MNEIREFLAEAFLGEEAYDPSPGREAMERALRDFDAQERLLRRLMWFAVLCMSGLAAWAAWSFARGGSEASTRSLVLHATLFLAAVQGVGWSKMFLFTTQKNLQVLKELKRLQLTLLRREGGPHTSGADDQNTTS